MAQLTRKSKQPTIFKYDTLRRAHNEIRLLEVLPPSAQKSDSDLRCTLTTYSRPDKCPPYTALSYTWGYEGQTHKIELNGQQHYVKDNVWRLLHELRTINPSGRFWIDAVCINQLAAYEKSWQVASMGSIYAGAEEVVAWLGPEYENSNLAMDWMVDRSSLSCTSFGKYGKKSGPTSKETTALLKLFSRPYWKRVWVVQEILLARNVIIMCGAKFLDWSSISRILDSMPEQKIEGVSLFDGISPETSGEVLLNEKGYWETHALEQQGLPLKFLLDTWGHMDATIPIDKIYAILGLSLSHDLAVWQDLVIEAGPLRGEVLTKIAFNISYFKRPTQVFADVLRSVLLFHLYQKDDLTLSEFLDFGTYLATILEVELDTAFIKNLYKHPFSNAPLTTKARSSKKVASHTPTKKSKESQSLPRTRWVPSSTMNNEGGPTDLLVLGGLISNHPLGAKWVDRDAKYNRRSRVRDSESSTDSSYEDRPRPALEVLRARLRVRRASRRQDEDMQGIGSVYDRDVSDLHEGGVVQNPPPYLDPSTRRVMFPWDKGFERRYRYDDRSPRGSVLGYNEDQQQSVPLKPNEVVELRARRAKLMAGYRRVEPTLIEAMFIPGRVLEILADELPECQESPDEIEADSSFPPIRRRFRPERRLSIKVRRYLVIERQGEHHSICVPISTYAGRGVTGRLDAAKHAVVYTTNDLCPSPRVGEEDMNNNAIQIQLTGRSGNINGSWRVNFGQPGLLEHNLRMKNIGKVCNVHLKLMQRYFRDYSGI